MLEKAANFDQKLTGMGMNVSIGGLSFGMSNDTFRFTEKCLVADREHNILGTCAPNPAPNGEHDRNLICKGQNEPTFLISSKGEKQVEKSLRRQAILLIAIGALVILGAFAIALHAAGLL